MFLVGRKNGTQILIRLIMIKYDYDLCYDFFSKLNYDCCNHQAKRNHKTNLKVKKSYFICTNHINLRTNFSPTGNIVVPNN